MRKEPVNSPASFEVLREQGCLVLVSASEPERTAPGPERIALDRLVAFANAGADCLYAPGVRDPEIIARIVKEVAPKPVNVFVSAPWITVAQLADLGVRRVSVGGALARAAWGGFIRAARELAEKGTFESFQSAAGHSELNDFFGTRP